MRDLVETPTVDIAVASFTADELEASIRSIPGHLTAEDFPVVHHFAPGVYARELTMAAGLIVLGKIHKTRHLNIITKGKVSFRAGSEIVQTVEVTGLPYTFM